jgi:hypothetical protein
VALNSISTEVTFESVSVTNSNDGINLFNVNQSAFGQFFRVTGDGVTAGSGGTMTAVNRGLVIDQSRNTSFSLMNIDANVTGVFTDGDNSEQPENLSLTSLSLTNSTNAANWRGFDINWGSAAHFDVMNVFTNNSIVSAGANSTGMRINIDRANPQVDFTIGGSNINLTGAGSTGIQLITNGFGPILPQNSGGIGLTAAANNTVVAPVILNTVPQNGATIEGQLLINNVLQP